MKLQGKDIYFLDVIDYLKDAFREKVEQTPTFVIQSSFKELFFPQKKTDGYEKIKSLAMEQKTEKIEEEENNIVLSKPKLIDMISKDAVNYIKKEQCLKLYDEIYEKIDNLAMIEGLEELFVINPEKTVEEFIPKADYKESVIGKWLSKDKEFFAETSYTSRTVEKEIFDEESPIYQRLMPYLTGASSSIFGMSGLKNIDIPRKRKLRRKFMK